MEYLEFTDLFSYLIFGIFILLMIFEKFKISQKIENILGCILIVLFGIFIVIGEFHNPSYYGGYYGYRNRAFVGMIIIFFIFGIIFLGGIGLYDLSQIITHKMARNKKTIIFLKKWWKHIFLIVSVIFYLLVANSDSIIEWIMYNF